MWKYGIVFGLWCSNWQHEGTASKYSNNVTKQYGNGAAPWAPHTGMFIPSWIQFKHENRHLMTTTVCTAQPRLTLWQLKDRKQRNNPAFLSGLKHFLNHPQQIKYERIKVLLFCSLICGERRWSFSVWLFKFIVKSNFLLNLLNPVQPGSFSYVYMFL